MTTRHTLTIDCDGVHNQCRCDLHDGHTVLVSESLADIEVALDRLENEGRLNTEVQGDAGTESEEAAVHRDRRGAEQD